MNRKGIILAVGSGARLYPATHVISKHLLPVFDKPMIYYPLSTLMLAGIRQILVISTPEDRPRFEQLLGDGSSWGIDLRYAEQTAPRGPVEAFISAESFLDRASAALIQGDNLFYGNDLHRMLKAANAVEQGATIFVYRVNNPESYSVAEFDRNGKVISLEEKPSRPKSRYAVTGIYFFDADVTIHARNVRPGKNGKLEITELSRIYMEQGKLEIQRMGRGQAWLDTSTHETLLEANQYIRTIEHRQGQKVCCPEEIAFRKKWIDAKQVERLAQTMQKNTYGQYLLEVLQELGETENQPG